MSSSRPRLPSGDRKLLYTLAAIGATAFVVFLLPSRSVRSEKLHVLSPCVLSKYNQQAHAWEKVSNGYIQSRDLLATSSEGCEIETTVGALELAPQTVASLEKTSDGWLVDVQEGRVEEIGSKNWQIIQPALHAAPLWFSPAFRKTKKSL